MILPCARGDLQPAAVKFIDKQKSFVPEASVYQLFKGYWLVTMPAFIVI